MGRQKGLRDFTILYGKFMAWRTTLIWAEVTRSRIRRYIFVKFRVYTQASSLATNSMTILRLSLVSGFGLYLKYVFIRQKTEAQTMQ